jgi:hypothetical protein
MDDYDDFSLMDLVEEIHDIMDLEDNQTDKETLEEFLKYNWDFWIMKLPMNQMLQIMFTEDEWNAIYNAMADYQDHGEEEAEIAFEIQQKITTLFETVDQVSSRDWHSQKSRLDFTHGKVAPQRLH